MHGPPVWKETPEPVGLKQHLLLDLPRHHNFAHARFAEQANRTADLGNSARLEARADVRERLVAHPCDTHAEHLQAPFPCRFGKQEWKPAIPRQQPHGACGLSHRSERNVLIHCNGQ